MNKIRTKRITKLDNECCVYCNKSFKYDKTKEHVIGRNFVPKKTLENKWNLIFNTCNKCNNKKSDLEDDISAITMQPDLLGKYPIDDERLYETSNRKRKKSISRKTNLSIEKSNEKKEIRVSHPSGIKFNFKFEAPPQIDRKRLRHLAYYHIAGMFYLLTYNEKGQRGFYWEGEFDLLNYFPRGDWGNARQISFMNQISNWPLRLLIITAEGFFKSVVRKHPEANCWAWALEWNMNYRLIGFCGNKEIIKSLYMKFENLKMHRIEGETTCDICIETPLESINDILFQKNELEIENVV